MEQEHIEEFAEEAKELIAEAETSLITLEKDLANAEAFDTVFRNYHSIKGTAMMCELDGLSNFTHKIESLLEQIQEGNSKMSSEIVDVVIRSTDVISNYLEAILEDPAAPLDSEALLQEIEKMA